MVHFPKKLWENCILLIYLLVCCCLPLEHKSHEDRVVCCSLLAHSISLINILISDCLICEDMKFLFYIFLEELEIKWHVESIRFGSFAFGHFTSLKTIFNKCNDMIT